MEKRFMRILLVFALIPFTFLKLFGSSQGGKVENVILINSYVQGFAWTDSLTSGISSELSKHSNIVLHYEYLNSKQFGQSNFDITSRYLKEKYRQIRVDGVMVTDKDALDFVFKYGDELFPALPVVFAGISNPEDYPLKGSNFFGFKEASNTDNMVNLIRQLLPDSKKIFVITDNTTTGQIYRRELIEQQNKLKDFVIEFPEDIDAEKICHTISTHNSYDAIFYIGINQDVNGIIVDNVKLLERIGKLAKVPLFSNDIRYVDMGVVGGLFQSGVKQGSGAANLLVQLMDNKLFGSFEHIYTQKLESFFDLRMLNKYGISKSSIPESAILFHQRSIVNPENFVFLLVIILFMVLVIAFLSIDRQRKKQQQIDSDNQLSEIENQKEMLEIASRQLEAIISELEETNKKLNSSNASLVEAKEKAEESDRLKSSFLANVSHEIRTPLNSIVGFSSLLAEPDLDDETKALYSGLIESNSETLLVLIDEIIDLSKIEAHQLTINMQRFSVDALLQELFEIFRNQHLDSPVELRVRKVSENKELFVFSDRVRVKQVLTNLLTNAYKFTEKNFIEMGYVETELGQIQLYVKDTGIGIEQSNLEVVFDRFRKLNDDDKKLYGGTGLGLAISKKLVELLGGQIWVTSEFGKGSVFHFTLSNLELCSVD